MTPLHVTYCGNAHPAEDLDAWLASVERYTVPVAAGVQRPFGLGAWWCARTAEELAHSEAARDRVRACLAAHDLTIWTLNVFPFGGFHDAEVKTAVYRPDWGHEDRLLYTRNAAEALGHILPEGSVAPMSTLPLGYGNGHDLRKMARNLARAASALADVHDRYGVEVILALEPEPFCILETVAQAAEFFERWLFAADAWTVPEPVLRRHLGVCIDLCHLAVVGEDPITALADLTHRGIRCPKVQVSSCLEVRDPRAGLDRLLAFTEPRYLHQTVADGGLRALDLDAVRDRRTEFAAAHRIRTHFHMPVFWDEAGAFGSTRDEVVRFLGALSAHPPHPPPLLEVETYTWSVLEDFDTSREGLVAGIRAELEFVENALRP